MPRRCHVYAMLVRQTQCDCDPLHPILVKTAWTIDNPGRRFKGCPIRDKDKKCGVYGFLDLELPSDYYKRLFYDLHEENKALKRMNKMSAVMEDSSKRLTNYSNNQMVQDLKDDLTFVKSKLKVYDRLILVVFGCVVFLSVIVLSSDSEDINDGPSKGKVSKEEPTVASVPNVDEYLKDTFFDSTDNDTTNNNIMDDYISDESDSPKSKSEGKCLSVEKNASQKVIKNKNAEDTSEEKYVPIGKVATVQIKERGKQRFEVDADVFGCCFMLLV
ncbi:hypothetical protein Tco_1041148 [Tanacetum coccineum]|uniref:Zinc finger GRF-type domain-containing protein n=1 Tax=Tanacetum coccineum TaxID=301880 RepID=A0ABQ5GHZ0_9ASTR